MTAHLFLGFIHKVNLVIFYQRIGSQLHLVEIYFVHTHRCNLANVMASVIMDSFVHIASERVDGKFVFTAVYSEEPFFLFYGIQDMEKLSDVFKLEINFVKAALTSK